MQRGCAATKSNSFAPAQLLAERNRPIRPRTVQLKAVLRQIDPDHVNLFHGRPLPRLALTTPPTWHIAMPSGGASTPSVTQGVSEIRAASAAEPAAVEFTVSALADEVGACAVALRPLYELIAAFVLGAQRLHSDDTPVPMLAKGKTNTARAWIDMRDYAPFSGQATLAPTTYSWRVGRLSSLGPPATSHCSNS